MREVEAGEKTEEMGEAGGKMVTEEERREMACMGGRRGQRGKGEKEAAGRVTMGIGEADGLNWTSPVAHSFGTPQNQL